jgi:hypothetical protein
MPPKRRKNSSLALIAWGLNITGVLALLTVFTLYWTRQPAQAAQEQLQAFLPGIPTATGIPTLYYLPTVTRNPLSTQIVVQTPTPFVLPNGPGAVVIGYSVSHRPLEVYQFGQGENQKMIVAGIHGGYEWNTIALADQLILYINEHPEIIPSDVTLYILRNLNPDGDARAHNIEGRVNDNGVDLNRNFPENWVKEWDRDNCWNYTATTGGEYPGSEPETKALMSFLGTHRVEALISYHSAALGIFPGGEPWEENSIRLAEAFAEVSSYPFPPLDIGCVYTGTLADYAVARGAAAVDMELTNHRDTDFNMNLRILKIFLSWEK